MALSRAGSRGGSAMILLFRIRQAGLSGGVHNATKTSVLLRSSSQQFCRFSSKAKHSGGWGSLIVSKLRLVNEKYERFLHRNFPAFYLLYSTFFRGLRLLLQDGSEVRRIKVKMARQGLSKEQLPYRDMETLRQFRRDIIKALPVALVSIPPFANYLVFVLMYFFPRQVLVRHFWTPKQQVEFQQVYHGQRARLYPRLVNDLTRTALEVTDRDLQSQLLQLCNKVQGGAHPGISEIQAVRRLFTGPPLGMKRLQVEHMRCLSSLFFLTSRLPAALIRRRLWSHSMELLQLDRALSMLGLHQLSEPELRIACYLRGLNSTCLSTTQCREWLYQWLQLSTRLKDSEASLLLHSMVLLSMNYPSGS
ncbi:LETM1 domain-containing protein 1 [Acipenser oxyrinchus oxyrinchus]|uniref:LETM1 domain-containing protein 1 n=1 Tax=Acipenser oxyrinchus oxyrinchus TaxID=40147 RepID=A0AAD8FRA7_ACIOX|nr:LETM1 domain-containing protein 1 [Acipenser oxyrinchus oxyrinchus]